MAYGPDPGPGPVPIFGPRARAQALELPKPQNTKNDWSIYREFKSFTGELAFVILGVLVWNCWVVLRAWSAVPAEVFHLQNRRS